MMLSSMNNLTVDRKQVPLSEIFEELLWNRIISATVGGGGTGDGAPESRGKIRKCPETIF